MNRRSLFTALFAFFIPKPALADVLAYENESYVRNCFIRCRPDNNSPWLFWAFNDEIKVRLDGYAIIPIEEYERLSGERTGLRQTTFSGKDV